MSEYVRVAVCGDCLHTAANGAEEVSDEFIARFDKASERGYLHPSCPNDGDCGCDWEKGYHDEWFSLSSCEFCGDRLAGSRYCATLEVGV